MVGTAVRPLQLSRVFNGTATLADSVRGANGKNRLIAQRMGAAGSTLEDAGRTILAPTPRQATPRREGKKCYPNAPTLQSIVDQIVFGRDMDMSGEDQFDEEFMCMFKGACGAQSGVLENRVQAKRTYENAPNQQSIVDQLVFNRDMDFSGETQYDEEFLHMYDGAAGKLSADLKRQGTT
mmetsp:Transcript_95014/g.174149  ORF Transcript_95014/g.174149 Transcript_95014/m.174149 type:complete len:180 (-) Transcript_95014:101-640(-)